MANPYFGKSWLEAVEDGAERADTPVGVPCSWCKVPVADGDQGWILGRAPAGDEPPWAPMHRECMAADTIGHLVDCCRSCNGDDWPDTPEGDRAMAIEAFRRLKSGYLNRE